jgi:adenylosuccinate synthase
MVFFDELKALADMDVHPVVSMDPRAQITTPWDMAINQTLEHLRGGERHGSCGLGFGETIERAEKGYGLSFNDLSSEHLPDILQSIFNDWVQPRLKELDLLDRVYPLKTVLTGQVDLVEKFREDCIKFSGLVSQEEDAYVSHADHLIFEGAQGLQLDMNLGKFPHVTRSLTGLPNMVDIALEAGIGEIDVIYMTRAYGTRHGAGPMPHEIGTTPPGFAEVVDKTNVWNDWQGNIRYGLLDLDGMKDVIGRDLDRVSRCDVICRPSIGITCLDQLKAPVDMVLTGEPVTLDIDDVDSVVPHALEMPLGLASRGPHRDKVTLRKVPDITDEVSEP